MFHTSAGGQAFAALYPANMTPTEFITALYQHLGNSVPDSEGLNFWTAQLAAKTGPDARAEIAAEVSFVLQVFDPTAASFLALTPEQQQAALNRAATYQNKIAVSEALAATGNPVFNPTAYNDATYKAEQALLNGVDQTAASRQAALDRVAAANAANNPALLVGGALTITLTPGIDVPPFTQTSLDNVRYLAADTLSNGTLVPTLNAGDKLVDTGKGGHIDILNTIAGPANYAGWTSQGIETVSIQKSQLGTAIIDFSGANSALKAVASSTSTGPGAVVMNNIKNLVEVDQTDSTNFFGLAVTYGAAVTGTQVVKDVSSTAPIAFLGPNAPTDIHLTFTGANTLTLTDGKLTTLTVDSTDTSADTLTVFTTPGAPLHLPGGGGSHSILTADLSGVKGALTAAFQDDAFTNGSTITLGQTATLNESYGIGGTFRTGIGESNGAGHTRDVITVNGKAGGVYDIVLGNQDDHINLGAHSGTDTLQFMHPWAANQNSSFTTPADVITGANLNPGGDIFNFSVAGFSSGFVNPATAGMPGGTTSTLFHMGNGAGPGAVIAPVVAGEAVNELLYNGTVVTVSSGGENLIHVNNLALNTADKVQTAMETVGTQIVFSAAPFAFGPVDFLVAYQAGTSIHIAEAHIGPTGAGLGHNTAFTATTTHVVDIIDIAGQTLNSSFASHLAFVA
jgi:hypothetical protein